MMMDIDRQPMDRMGAEAPKFDLPLPERIEAAKDLIIESLGSLASGQEVALLKINSEEPSWDEYQGRWRDYIKVLTDINDTTQFTSVSADPVEGKFVNLLGSVEQPNNADAVAVFLRKLDKKNDGPISISYSLRGADDKEIDRLLSLRYEDLGKKSREFLRRSN